MKKKMPGSGLKFSAVAWNRMAATAEFFVNNEALGRSKRKNPLVWDRNIIRIKNMTGALRRRGDWLAVRSPPIGPAGTTQNNLVKAHPGTLIFNGEAPTSRDDTICCLLTWVPDGKIALAQVSGVCWGLVDVNDRLHRYAEPKVTNNALYNADSTPYPGPIRIVSNRTSGTGQILCACEITQQASRLSFDVIQSGSLTLSTSDQNVAINGTVGGVFDLNDNLTVSTPEVTIRRSRLYSITINGRFAVSLAQNRGVDYELRLQRNTGSGYSDLFLLEGGDCIVDAAIPTGHSTFVRRLERTDVHQLNSGDLVKLVAKKTDRNGGMTVALTEAGLILRS